MRRTAGIPTRGTGPCWPRRTAASSSPAPTGACSRSRPRRFSMPRADSVRSPGGRERVAYDRVIVAVGFRARWFETLLGDEAHRRLGRAEAGLERRIDVDLSV